MVDMYKRFNFDGDNLHRVCALLLLKAILHKTINGVQCNLPASCQKHCTALQNKLQETCYQHLEKFVAMLSQSWRRVELTFRWGIRKFCDRFLNNILSAAFLAILQRNILSHREANYTKHYQVTHRSRSQPRTLVTSEST